MKAAALLLALTLPATAQLPDQLALGRRALTARAGCFLVDYSFAETDAVKPGYTQDHRVYDVNRDKSIKELIYVEELSPSRFWLQHILFGDKLTGQPMEGSLLKHTAEDWSFNAPFLYGFEGAATWTPHPIAPNLWTRRVVSLDDGLRYQCAAAYQPRAAYPDWTCADRAPIPGRETRDMHRKDYNELDRTSRLIVYGDSWLEREDNTKVLAEDSTRTPLVKEVGKTWYVRLPESECASAKAFVTARERFWQIERQAWDEVLTGKASLKETPVPKDRDVPSRYERILDLEEKYIARDLADPGIAKECRDAIRKVIDTSVTLSPQSEPVSSP